MSTEQVYNVYQATIQLGYIVIEVEARNINEADDIASAAWDCMQTTTMPKGARFVTDSYQGMEVERKDRTHEEYDDDYEEEFEDDDPAYEPEE